MTLIRYNNQFPRFFDDFFTKDLDRFFEGTAHATLPAVNVQEDEKGFNVEVSAPGFKKEDFKVELNQDVLTIATEQDEQSEEKNQPGNYVKREFRHRAFKRSFRLPEQVVDGDKIEARYEAGILQLTLPKREEVKPKPARLIDIA